MGIIAGIAIPTTIAVINRQKKNSAVKSAQNVLGAAKTVLMEAAAGENITYVPEATQISSADYEVKVADLVTNGELETNPIDEEVYIGITSDNKFVTNTTTWTINTVTITITIAANGEWSFSAS